MPTPEITADAFLELLERSGLVTEERWRELMASHESSPQTPAIELARGLVQQGVLTRYQAERLLEGRPRGFFIEHFRVLELLGAGGMSFLYLALNQQTGERVALKVVTEKHRDDAGMLTRLKLESRAGQRLRHPNVVQTYGMRSYEDVFGEIHYLVMEFVEGINLEEMLQLEHSIPWEQVCDFGKQSAEGLRAAHRAGIIHRDVKPANLLVDRQGQIHLLDFGLALLESREDADEFSLAMIFGHDCLGTADFIAPEQTIDSFSVDARADIYSLGCMLYTIFSGRVPFPTAATRDKIEAHRNRTAPPIGDLVPGLPTEVAALLGRMMAKRREDRPASMDEVITLLGKFARRHPVEFDFPRILAYRASQARKRLRAMSPSTARGAAGGSSRALSHWTTSSTRKLPHVTAETAIEDAAVREMERTGPVALTPDPGFGAATVTTVPQAVGLEMIALNGGPAIRLTRDRIVVGRNPECDVVIAHGAVSGRHCEFRRTSVGWFLADLGSKNGVQVNDRLLTGAGSEYPLHPGDRVVIGRALKYQFPAENDGDAATTGVRASRGTWAVWGGLLAILAGAVIWFVWRRR